MTHTLLILRHAKSSWDTDATSDFERPLNKRGLKEAPRLGQWMRSQALVPDYVVCSPAERARQTALLVIEGLGVSAEDVSWDMRVYEATDSTALIEVVSGCPPTSQCALLIGHNPALEALLDDVCAPVPTPPQGKHLATATLAEVALDTDWAQVRPGAGILKRITRAKQLP